ncbi:MAG: acyl-CoA dehydrogenase [Alphaproteobacteria bacterium]|nr:acyl-CoA dehydrogenase [Alphaproteobacteria bacterium]
MNDANNLVAEAAERLFADLSTPAVVRAAEQGIWPDALWHSVEEAGFCTALEPDSGVSLGETLAILRAAGRHAAPIPLPETMLARAIAARAGLTPPEGPLSIAVSDQPTTLRLEARHFSGTMRRVPFARQVKAIVALAHDNDRSMVVCAPAERARLTPGRNLAGEPRDDVVFDRLELSDGGMATAPKGIHEAWGFKTAALLRSAQMVGALDAALAMAVRYANERTQFGRPIGKFQAIQHQLAALGGEVAASSAMLDAAAEAVAMDRPSAALAVASAKARASEAAGIAATIAHRVHGAIGFTREFALQDLTRRLLSWRDDNGSERYWQSYIGHEALAPKAAPLWPFLSTP